MKARMYSSWLIAIRIARRALVERWKQVVYGKAAHLTNGIGDVHLHIAIPPQQRQQVGIWQFPPVDLTGLQGCRRGRGIGHHDPLDALRCDASWRGT